jgi:hypothetical protein
MSRAHPSAQFFSFVAGARPFYPDTVTSMHCQEIAVMSSSGRNISRANSARRSGRLGAGVALTLMSGAAFAGAHQFVFTAYGDAAGGADVLAGRYHAAVEELKNYHGVVDTDPPATDTNRCVAYSMTLQWRQARTACDAAVRAAAMRRNEPEAWWSRPASADDYMAVAYANRAVMHWMLHEDTAARGDLAAARQLSPQADFVARNLAALRVHSLVAQAGASAPKS